MDELVMCQKDTKHWTNWTRIRTILIIQNNAIQHSQHVLHLQVTNKQVQKHAICTIFLDFLTNWIRSFCLFVQVCRYDFSFCLGFGDGEEYPFDQDHGTQTNGTIAKGRISFSVENHISSNSWLVSPNFWKLSSSLL